VRQNEPMDCCLECEWNHILRNAALDDIFFYAQQESILKNKLIEIKKHLREAENRYEKIWKQFELLERRF
jgi:hypothetical protein